MSRTIGKAEDMDLDPAGGKWVVFCNTHGNILNVKTQKAARSSQTIDFCEDCMDLD